MVPTNAQSKKQALVHVHIKRWFWSECNELKQSKFNHILTFKDECTLSAYDKNTCTISACVFVHMQVQCFSFFFFFCLYGLTFLN